MKFSSIVSARIKSLAKDFGRVLPPRLVFTNQGILNYITLGLWTKAHGFPRSARLRSRGDVYRHIATEVVEPVLYLEFGVFSGESIAEWSNLLVHPESQLIGFDSFEGLPEDFDFKHRTLKGELSTQGQIPEINDSRVRFVKGWFHETVPQFSIPRHKSLILNIDCDLYSATKTVLNSLNPHITIGTLIIFDDMSQIHHEPTAFSEYMRDTKKDFKLVTESYEDVFVFECTGE